MTITDLTFAPATRDQTTTGLLGWITCTVGSLRLDGIALRRTRDGRFTLAFPSRRDRSGREHYAIRPMSDRARREFERQVFDLLGLVDVPAP